MSEKRSYPVVLSFYNKFIGDVCYRVKYQKATSLESAQKIVAGYCEYHRKRQHLVSKNSIIVIQKPIYSRVTFTYNYREHCSDALAVLNILVALKSVAGVTIREFLLANDIKEYHLWFDCDDFLEPVIKDILFKAQKAEDIVDYSVVCSAISPECWVNEYGTINGSLSKYL